MSCSITRREFMKTAAGAFGLALGGWPFATAPAGSAPASPRRPNILFIMTDQESTEMDGCYGNKLVKTPARDALAAGGVRFTNHYIAAFPCSPSRATMITGRYSFHHGILTNDMWLDPAIPTLATALGAAGYATGWIGKSHLGGNMYPGVAGTSPLAGYSYHQCETSPEGYHFHWAEGGVGEDGPIGGFQHWVGGWKHYKDYLKTTDLPESIRNDPGVGGHNDLPSAPDDQHAYSRVGERHHMAHFLADEAIRFIRGAAAGDKPFCCVLSFYGPHLPVAPPQPWDTMIDLKDIELPANFNDPQTGKPVGPRTNPRLFVRPHWTDEQARDFIRRALGYVSYIDAQIARVLASLDETGRSADTIVLFTSDHGEMLTQHGMIYKGTLYNTLFNVPLIMRWPGRLPAGQVNDRLVSNIDLLPTLLDLAGVPIPEGVDGMSLKPLMQDPRLPGREAVFTYMMDKAVVRRGEWKFSFNFGELRCAGGGGERDFDELYNLKDDPHELTNLALDKDHAVLVAELKALYVRFLTEAKYPYVDAVRAADALPTPICRGVLPAIERLEDLGGGRFAIDYAWRITEDLVLRGPTQDRIQLLRVRGNRREVAWSTVQPTTPPPRNWQAGQTYPRRIEGALPEDMKPGAYMLAVGLVTRPKPIRLASGYPTDMPLAEVRVTRDAAQLRLSLRPYRA
ncbi:MAG: sulfatase-like hydrolase/transferase [bacterium]|nr:sulfatase-like hydrolase/transferase [bacterium]